MRWLSAAEYLNLKATQRDWLVPGLIPQGVWILLVAPPKEGKSFLALQLAYQLAAGRVAFGHAPVRPLHVTYVDIDSPPAEVRERLDLLLGEAPEGPHFRLIHPDDIERPVDITTPTGRAWLAAVRETQPELVVLDVLREFHNVDEDRSHEFKRVADAIAAALPPPITLLIVHHTKKIPDDAHIVDPVKYARGSGGIAGRVDAIWLLHKNVWHLVPRYEQASKVKLQRDDCGFWRLTETAQQTKAAQALSLCAAYPELDHGDLVPIAHSTYGWSRNTFYKHLRGQPCVHRKPPTTQNPVLTD